LCKPQKAFGIYEACKTYGNEGAKDFEKCENPLDIYVVPCLMCDGKNTKLC